MTEHRPLLEDDRPPVVPEIDPHIRHSLSGIRLVACDLDGTLLNEAKQISPANRAAVDRLRAAGIGFTVATGRMEEMAASYIRELDLDIPVISCNGAQVRDPRSRRILELAPIDRSDGRRIITWLMAQDIDFLVYTPNAVYHLPGSQRISYIQEHNAVLRASGEPTVDTAELPESGWIECLDHQLIKILAMVIHPRQDRLVHAMLRQTGCSGVYSWEFALDIMRRDVSKGSALTWLAEWLRIPMDQVAAIGDHDNDAEMLRIAGLGIAMPQASDAALASADIVLNGVQDVGVAEAAALILDSRDWLKSNDFPV